MGSHHSLTPCAVTDGTVVSMEHLTRVLRIDHGAGTITAEAGLQYIDAATALRKEKLQFMLNIEIGNMTLGSAACCHTKDALDGIEFGQVGSYVTRVKWVDPRGDLQEASEDSNPDLLRRVRSSYGLCGIIYEVTLRVKPIEAAQFTYLPRSSDELTQAEVDGIIQQSEGLVCWTLGRTSVFQTKKRITDPAPARVVHGRGTPAAVEQHRRVLGARDRSIPRRPDRGDGAGPGHPAHPAGVLLTADDRRPLHPRSRQDDRLSPHRAQGAVRLHVLGVSARPSGWRRSRPTSISPTSTIGAPGSAATCRSARTTSGRTRRRCCRTRTTATSSRSIRSTRRPTRRAWDRFLKEFNEFATKRNGIPLLNQSPFVTRAQCEKAFGPRWAEFSQWVRSVDPDSRMVNPFFRELLVVI